MHQALAAYFDEHIAIRTEEMNVATPEELAVLAKRIHKQDVKLQSLDNRFTELEKDMAFLKGWVENARVPISLITKAIKENNKDVPDEQEERDEEYEDEDEE